MKVLVIGQVWPEPRSSAAGSHMMQILAVFLQQGWQITFASTATPGENRAELKALGIDEQSITLNCDSFNVFVTALQPDIVLFDRFMIEEQFGWRVAQHCPQALRLLETSDLHCLRITRQQQWQRYQKAAGDECDLRDFFAGSASSLYDDMAQQEVTLREIAAIHRCDLSLMISRVEIDLLVQHFGVAMTQLLHCPLMTSPVNPADWRPFAARSGIVTIGNFHHAPNRDGVQWLKQWLWPAIRARLPDVSLHIYGAYTPQQAREMHKPAQGFHVMGWAEDALAVMRNARLCVAPLRFGAGIKGKLFDAMLCGTPSVTTRIGAESMRGEDEAWCGAIADDVDSFADAVTVLYQDAERWQQAQRQCEMLLKTHFADAPVAACLLARIAACRADLAAHRRRHFTGLMLQHHQHRSTEYLSRWIMAKNRLSE